MDEINTERLLDFLESDRPTTRPASDKDLTPSYDIYGLAPYLDNNPSSLSAKRTGYY